MVVEEQFHAPLPSSDLLRLRMIGAILSSMLFSVAFMFGACCLFTLNRSYKALHRRNHSHYLSAYVILMLSISIFSVIENVLSLFSLVFHGFHFLRLKSGSPIALPLAVWGADGFMLWRCLVLYQDVSRVPRNIVCSIVAFLGIKALGLGILAFLPLLGFMGSIILIAFTTAINLIILGLIVIRLIQHQVYLTKVLGIAETRSPYSIIMIMCLESSALIVIIGVVCIVAAIANPNNANAIQIPLQMMPQICVISPMLIVYRVAQGRAETVTKRPPSLEPLQFRTSQASKESA